MKRSAFALFIAITAVAPAAPARHRDPNCTLTVHRPLGTDSVVVPTPVDPPIEIPTDIGFIKIHVDCHHSR